MKYYKTRFPELERIISSAEREKFRYLAGEIGRTLN